MRGHCWWLFTCVFCVCNALKGVGIPVGGEYPLVSILEGHQTNPNIVLWNDGGLVVWENTSRTGTKRILIQSLDTDGKGMGQAHVLSQNSNGINDVNPDIIKIDANRAMVVWSSGKRGNSVIYKTIVGRNCEKIGGIERVSEQKGLNEFPKVGISKDGTQVVVWESNLHDGDGRGVAARFYTNAVHTPSEIMVLSQSTAGNQVKPIVVGLPNNRFMMAWVQAVNLGKNAQGGAKLRSHVMGRIFDRQRPYGNEFRISGVDVVAQKVVAAVDTSGKMTFVWMQITDLNSQDKHDIWAAKVDSENGLVLGAPYKVNQYSTHTQKNPVIVRSLDEEIIIWESIGQDLGGKGIVATSSSVKEEFVVNTQRNLDQMNPTIAVDGAGRAIVAWANTIKADQSIISAQQFLLNSEGGKTIIAENEQNQNKNIDLHEAAPVISAPQEETNPPRILDTKLHSDDNNSPEFPEFPKLPEIQVARGGVHRSGDFVPGSQNAYTNNPEITQITRNNAGMFPLRSDVRKRMGLLTPSQAAVNSIENLGKKYSQVRSSSNLKDIKPIRAGVSRGNPNSSTVSRSGIIKFAKLGGHDSKKPVGRTGIRLPSVRPNSLSQGGAFKPSQRNSAIAAKNPRSGPNKASAKASGFASSRIELMRRQAEQANNISRFKRSMPIPVTVNLSGAEVSIAWDGVISKRYQVQGSNDKSSWVNYGGAMPGSPSMQTNVGRKFKYYRVIQSD